MFVDNIPRGLKRAPLALTQGIRGHVVGLGPENDLTDGLDLVGPNTSPPGKQSDPWVIARKHPALELAKVLTASDYFLTGVAPFLKVHPFNPLEVNHLGDELLNCTANDPGLPRKNFEPSPIRSRRR
jgi:hypothetical protein